MTKAPGVCGGTRACIDSAAPFGSWMSCGFVRRPDPEKILGEYPDLTLEQVYGRRSRTTTAEQAKRSRRTSPGSKAASDFDSRKAELLARRARGWSSEAPDGAKEHGADLARLQVPQPLPAQLAALLVPGSIESDHVQVRVEPQIGRGPLHRC